MKYSFKNGHDEKNESGYKIKVPTVQVSSKTAQVRTFNCYKNNT